MHSCVTASCYNWPEAAFPLCQAAVRHRSIAVNHSSGLTELSPFLTGGGETARWQKVEVSEPVDQIVSLCHFQSATYIGIRGYMPVRPKNLDSPATAHTLGREEHQISQGLLKPFQRVVFKDNVVFLAMLSGSLYSL
jgi:hypothetical protein